MSAKRFVLLSFVLSSLLLVAACGQGQPPSSADATSAPTVEVATPISLALPTPTLTLGAESSPTPSSVAVGTTATPTEAAAETATLLPETATPSVVFPPTISLQPALEGFQSPVYLTYATVGDSDWLFVVEKEGRIYLVEKGQVQSTPFLDITERVGSQGSEQGLLSVAFAPDFAASGLLYVNYTNRRGDTVVARYRLLPDDPRRADASSEQQILQISQPAANHNGGQLKFGPEGYLYVGMGDGGRAGDPWGNAQNLGVLLGKMLRIDVANSDTYAVPADNPFVDLSGARPEIWAYGLRNPWRFSFDRSTNDLYIADVGQNVYEEVHLQPATSRGGENYGWDVMEGNHCFEPQTGCDQSGLELPVAEYDHSLGCSITGGYVYRGIQYPGMAGVYFFGDFCSGNIWGLRQSASGEWQTALLLETDLSISSFGEDGAGELYVLGYGEGIVYHLVASP